MEKITNYSKVAAIISIVLIAATIVMHFSPDFAKTHTMMTLAPFITFAVVCTIFFAMLMKADNKFVSAAMIGVIAYSLKIIQGLLMITMYLVYKYTQAKMQTLFVIEGAVIYIFYLLLFISFFLLSTKLKGQNILKATSILFPIISLAAFLFNMISGESTFIADFLPFVGATFFFISFYSTFKNKA